MTNDSKLTIPPASSRPQQASVFSSFVIPPVTAARRPAIDAEPASFRELAYGLVRVLDDDHQAGGDWCPDLSPEQLREGLRSMLHVRLYDQRMFQMQRQGQLSFYMKSTGEEAIGVAQAMALQSQDMLFPSYRQQGLLFARKRPVVDLSLIHI